MPYHRALRHSTGRGGIRRHSPAAATKKKVRFDKTQDTRTKTGVTSPLAQPSMSQPEKQSEKVIATKMPLSQTADGGNIAKPAEKDKSRVGLTTKTSNTVASSPDISREQAPSTVVDANGLLTPKAAQHPAQPAQQGAPVSLLASSLGHQVSINGHPLSQFTRFPVDSALIVLDHWVVRAKDGNFTEAPKLQGCGPWEVPLPPGMDPAVHVNPHAALLCRYLDCWINGDPGTQTVKVHPHPLMRGQYVDVYIAKRWSAWKMIHGWAVHLEQYGKNEARAPSDIVTFVQNRIVSEGGLAREGAVRAIEDGQDSVMFSSRSEWRLPAIPETVPNDHIYQSVIGSAMITVHRDKALKEAAAYPANDNSVGDILDRSPYVNPAGGIKHTAPEPIAKNPSAQPENVNSAAGIKRRTPLPTARLKNVNPIVGVKRPAATSDAAKPAAKPALKKPRDVIVVDDDSSSSSSDSEDEPLAKRARQVPQPKRATKPVPKKAETKPVKTKPVDTKPVDTKPPRRRGRPVGSKNKNKKVAVDEEDVGEDAAEPVRRMIRIKVPVNAAEKLAAMAKAKTELANQGKPIADK